MRLPKEVVSDLALVRDLNPGALRRLYEQIEAPGTSPDSLAELSEIAGRALSDQPKEGSTLVDVLHFLSNNRRRLQLSVDEIVGGSDRLEGGRSGLRRNFNAGAAFCPCWRTTR